MYILVYVQKGGETKSTTTVNLAAVFALWGMKGTVVDANPTQGTVMNFAGSILGVTFTRTVPMSCPEGEFVIVDGAPSFTPDVARALKQCDLVLMPLTASPEAAEQLVSTFETLLAVTAQGGDFHGLVAFTRFERGHTLAVAMTRFTSQWPVARTAVPKRVSDFQGAFAAKNPVVLNAKRSAGAKAYTELAREIQELLS